MVAAQKRRCYRTTQDFYLMPLVHQHDSQHTHTHFT